MIDKLEFVLALARERHFGRAAEACRVTQPTLSAGLKSLEEALGVLLVNRSSRFQGFTPEGERVLDWARRIVGDAKAMRQDLDGLKRGLNGHLRIGVIPTALPVVARLTAPFRARHPDVRFTVLSRTSAEILRLMENLEVDAGLSYTDNEPLGHVRTVPLYGERYHLVTHLGHALARRASVTWADVGRLPLCLLTPDMQNRRIVDGILRDAAVETRPTLESDSTIVLLSHVMTGLWSSVLSATLVEGIAGPGRFASIPIVDPDLRHAVGLLVPHREHATHLVTALVGEARRLARDFHEG